MNPRLVRFRLASALAVLLLASQGLAQTLTVEDADLVDVPASVAAAVAVVAKDDFTNHQGEPCRFIGKAVRLGTPDRPARGWIVTTANACSWAASAAPVWVVRRGPPRDEVVLFHVTYGLTLGRDGSNGLRHIATARATAARHEEQLWKFDGSQYGVARHRVRSMAAPP